MKQHLLARAVIFDREGRLLIAQARGWDNTFLPGGHIDPGEGAEQALVRELAEEMGVAGRAVAFLGAVEAMWPSPDPTNYEVNLVFRVEAEVGPDPVSREGHLTFRWSPLDQLDEVNFLPEAMRPLLRRYAGGDRSIWWANA
ncbi:MAG TPA: NUDIX domain-containing protein [Symbiobacteriaceae bacterium]|nr:NUDIX domain-containing protein [Symbiobacteriaceae bacterium]